MKVVVLANLRWYCQCPSWFRLVSDSEQPVDLIYNGDHWYLTNGEVDCVVPDRDTGAMLLAKKLNEIAAREQG